MNTYFMSLDKSDKLSIIFLIFAVRIVPSRASTPVLAVLEVAQLPSNPISRAEDAYAEHLRIEGKK